MLGVKHHFLTKLVLRSISNNQSSGLFHKKTANVV